MVGASGTAAARGTNDGAGAASASTRMRRESKRTTHQLSCPSRANSRYTTRSCRDSGAPHAEGDRAGIAALAGAFHGERRLPAAVTVDRIVTVPRVSRGGTRFVGRGLVDPVREAVREVQLARVDDGAADMHFDVNMYGPAPIPAGVDGAEYAVATGISPLNPAQKRVRVRGSGI